MDICELTAAYDEVLTAESSNRLFTNEKEIVDTIKSLVSQGILQERTGGLNNDEIKYLHEFGDIRSNDKRVVCFTGKINKEIHDLRLKLDQQLFYPK